MTINNKAKSIVISKGNSGQRLDNFLISKIKNIPKSHIYKLIRTGQVRVNSSRSKPSVKVKIDDIVRIPPYRGTEELKPVISKELSQKTEDNILFEDRNIIVFNKPTAFTVHSGTKSGYGLIDVIREVRNDCERIDLLHRLDKDTSGCIIFTKNLKSLRDLQNKIICNEIEKKYICLVHGLWEQQIKEIEIDLRRNNKLEKAISKFKILRYFHNSTLLEVNIITGRYHQIRKHCSLSNHPIICDTKYGDRNVNKIYKNKHLGRIFLHATSLKFDYNGKKYIKSPLPEQLKLFLDNHS
tara:strand:+ start:249 stop:1139 length:891 start_codon:yes stop_codon:yes gene_type:complete